MKKFNLLALALLFCLGLSAKSEIDRPKLVVGIVVDQMRWDYLYYYYDEYREDGLKRLLNEGFSCENTMINYVPTVTAIGHSSIYTGSVPSITGIAGNDFLLNGHHVTSVTDTTVTPIGAVNPGPRTGKCSPRNLLAGTIGDALKIATDFKSKVFGVAIKDRASILPAGHAADAAYWWDMTSGHFITSSYYMDKLPMWVTTFNKTHQQESGKNINEMPLGVTLTFQMAEELLSRERLGKDEFTDLLAISISPTDGVGHAFSTRGKENHDVYMQLDKELAHFLNKLDQTVGHDNYLLFLSADHGAIHNPNFSRSHKIPSYGWDGSATDRMLQEGLKAKFGADGKYIKAIMDMRIYLNTDFIEKSGLDYAAVKQEAVRLLREDPQFLYVVDYDNIESQSIPQVLRERIINGYHHGRTGDIGVMLRANMMHGKAGADYKGTTHGTWSPEDAHIPQIFFGWHVNKGATSTPTYIVDAAPTVCAMLHIQMPNGCIGNAIQEVFKK